MGKFGFVGPSYTAKSNTVADEECINFYPETNETPGAQASRSYFGTPGLLAFTTFDDGPTRGGIEINGRAFEASGQSLYEVFADGTNVKMMDGILDPFGGPVSIAASDIELLVVAGQRAYSYELADNTFTDVTSQLAGGPIKAVYSDGYFIVCFAGSNKYQISAILDGTTWPGIQVNAVSVFPDDIVSIAVSHRELWVYGNNQSVVYADSGSDEIFDVIPGGFVETGCGPTFSPCLLDNTLFWISGNSRGARQGWRASGYTPQRVTTHAVEVWLSQLPLNDFNNLVSYSYQDGGHEFWVLYVPNSDATWVYDVAESLWHKRAEWDGTEIITPPSWEYTNATGDIWMTESRPLANHSHTIQWSNFALPSGNPLPLDAVIQGIYPVIVASSIYLAAVQRLFHGADTFPGEFTQPYQTNPVNPGASYSETVFWDISQGIDPAFLSAAAISAQLEQSLHVENMTDHTNITGCGYAIYYTSATPLIDPQIPPPFAVPAGQGVVFAVPSVAVTNQDPSEGFRLLTASSLTSGTATFFYDSLFGPVPVATQLININATTSVGAGANNSGVTVTTASGGTSGSFTVAGFSGGPDVPLGPETGTASQNTGAERAAAATATFIPGTDHEPTFTWGPHRSWNHIYIFGKHLVGDWKTGTMFEMKLPVDNNDGTYGFVTDNGELIRRVRRAPTLNDEMEWVYYTQLLVDFATGLGPQPALTDGDGNPRPPQAMLRWSNNGGSTWSNQHIASCGFAGEYDTRVVWRRLGRGRKRVFEVSVTDPIPWAITDAYLKTS